MRGKLLFIVGGLIGYVLGARAGRKRYEQIAAAANDLWNAKPIQRRVTEARDFALEVVGDVPATLFDAGKKVVRAVQGKAGQRKTVQGKDASAPAAKKTSARTTGTSASKTPAAKAAAATSAAGAKVASTETAKAPAARTTKPAAASSASADETTTK